MLRVPWLVVGRNGAQVIRDETRLHPVVRAQFVERRKHRPLWWASNGFVAGLCGGYVTLVAAEASQELVMDQWATPSGLMAVVAFLTMVFALGQMWAARLEDRRRLTKLEEESATKSDVSKIASSVQRFEDKLDRVIERMGHTHETTSR